MSVQKTLILAIALLLVVSAGAGAASQRVNWTWSGAAIQDVALAEAGCKMSLIEVNAKGSPGPAKIKGLNRNCSGPKENSLVAVFKDGSLLNILSAGPPDVFIPDFDCGEDLGDKLYGIYVETPVRFNGGFGRFSNATGDATLKITACPVGTVVDGPSYLMWEYGTITGTLNR